MMTTSSTTHAPQDFPHSFAPLLDRDYARPDFLKGLKTLMATAQERIRNEHNAGARGRNVVRHLTALVDDVVRTVFQYVQAQHPTATESCALVALGGEQFVDLFCQGGGEKRLLEKGGLVIDPVGGQGIAGIT